MAKYSEKAQKAIEKTMHEYKRGKLRSGGTQGRVVKKADQAVAIGISKARQQYKKVPT